MTVAWLGVDLLRLAGPGGLRYPMDHVVLVGGWWEALGLAVYGLALAVSFLVGWTRWPVWVQWAVVCGVAVLREGPDEAMGLNITDSELQRGILFSLVVSLIVNTIARRRAQREEKLPGSRSRRWERPSVWRVPAIAFRVCCLLGCAVGVAAIAWGAAGLWTNAGMEPIACRRGVWLIYGAITTFGLVVAAFCVREMKMARASRRTAQPAVVP